MKIKTKNGLEKKKGEPYTHGYYEHGIIKKMIKRDIQGACVAGFGIDTVRLMMVAAVSDIQRGSLSTRSVRLGHILPRGGGGGGRGEGKKAAPDLCTLHI